MQYAVKSKSPYLRGLDPIYTYRQDLRILPDEVYERNQQIVNVRKRMHSHTQTSPHLFSGLLRCPLCDAVMSGKRELRILKSKQVERFSYSCSQYNHTGPHGCAGYWVNEREVINGVLPVFVELLQKNLREHLEAASATNTLHTQIEGEAKAELAQVNLSMKNLLDAVKAGALSMEQIKEDNLELQEAKRRLEKRLNDLNESTRIQREVAAVLKVFDSDLNQVMTDLMNNRLGFNTFLRLFFSKLQVEVDRPGMGWRKGKRKGELPECNAHIKKYAFEPHFAEFVDKSGIKLPEALERAERYSENRWDNQGSPSLATRSWSAWEFLEALHVFLIAAVAAEIQSPPNADPNVEVGFFLGSSTCHGAISLPYPESWLSLDMDIYKVIHERSYPMSVNRVRTSSVFINSSLAEVLRNQSQFH
jgi:hypothetical protein